ncbi:MAG: F0F1 ATP synthase subunit delta [Bacteroidales bacterium]
MNTGIIATRYATALLKLVDETGSGELVAAQVQVIEKALDEVPDFRRAVDDPAVAAVQKISLFEASLKDSMAQELHKFLELLIRNGRIGDVRLVLTTFVTEYYRSRHIKRARLVVADPALLDPEPTPSDPVPVEGSLRQAQRPALESRLRELIGKETGCELLLETKVDPSLIGGFVFEVEDMILDASVSRQLDVIRHQFIEKNRRIV